MHGKTVACSAWQNNCRFLRLRNRNCSAVSAERCCIRPSSSSDSRFRLAGKRAASVMKALLEATSVTFCVCNVQGETGVTGVNNPTHSCHRDGNTAGIHQVCSPVSAVIHSEASDSADDSGYREGNTPKRHRRQSPERSRPTASAPACGRPARPCTHETARWTLRSSNLQVLQVVQLACCAFHSPGHLS